MIRIVDEGNYQPIIKKRMSHNKDIFIQARDFYHNHEDYRQEQIAVYDDNDNLMYMLEYEKNKITYPKLQKKVQLNLYVSDFWSYDVDSPRMDFEYIKDIDVFVFAEVEEYSVQATRVIMKYFPDKEIYYKDDRAKLFFGDDVIVGEPVEDESKTIIQINSKMVYYIQYGHMVLTKTNAGSINLMSSLYWLKDAVSFGEENPDKVFYVIKSAIASSGLVKFISFLLYFTNVAYKKEDFELIPVLDTAIPGDNNQFNDGKYADVWGMFFKPVSDYSLEEVYNSKNVIIGLEGKMGANPYLMPVEYHSNIGPLMKEYLILNEEVDEYCTKVRQDIGFDENKKMLGVIGRGTDFNNPGVAQLHTLPLGPQEIVDKAKEMYEAGGYDGIYLATEDAKVFETFMSSELKDVTTYVDQKRYSIDVGKELLHNVYLEEAQSGQRNGYKSAVEYISILECLRRCYGILASTDCGAVDYAMAMRDGEVADLYIHGQDTNEFLKNK